MYLSTANENMTILLKAISGTRSDYVKDADYLAQLADFLIEALGISCDYLDMHDKLQAFHVIPREEWEWWPEPEKDKYFLIANEGDDVLILVN